MAVTFTHDPESIFQASFYAAESTYGTEPTGATKTQFATLNIQPTFNMNKNAVNTQGATLPVAMTQGITSTEWSGEGQLCWEELAFLSGIAPTVSTSAFSGGVVSNTESSPNAYTLYHRDFKASGCAVSGFSIKGDTEQITTNVNFVGKGIVTGQTAPTVSPVTPTLFVPYLTTVKIGSAEQSKVNSWSLDVSNIWSLVNYLGASNTPNQTVAQQGVDAKFECVMPYDKSMALDILTDNTVHTVEVKNVTTVGGYTYTLTIGFDMMFDSADAPSDTDNIWTLPVKGVIMAKANNAISLTGSKVAVSSD